LVLDDPEEMSPAAANVALAEANSAGQAPVILLSSRWAARAQHGLKGFVSGIALRDAVSSWTLVARELRPRDDLGGPSGGETRPEPG
jgi:hypothetical protein